MSQRRSSQSRRTSASMPNGFQSSRALVKRFLFRNIENCRVVFWGELFSGKGVGLKGSPCVTHCVTV